MFRITYDQCVWQSKPVCSCRFHMLFVDDRPHRGRKVFFLKVYCIVYICVWLCVYACRYERWELPNVDAGNPAFVLWKNSKCSRAIAKPSLQPQVGKRFMMGMEIIACLFKHLNTYAYTPLQSASTNSNNLK